MYGMWRLGDDSDTSTNQVQKKIELCLEQGITTFDQADIYGDYESERILGAALKASPSLRSKMEIVTKCDIMLTSDKFPNRRVKYYDTSAEHLRTSVENSLERMAVDTIDLLLLHRPDPLMDPVDTGSALDALVASGKVRSVGVSNFRPYDWELLQSGMSTPLQTNQIELSLLETEAMVNGDCAFHQRHKHPLMAWSPLGGGRLFDQQNTALKPLSQRLGELAAEQSVSIDTIAVAWLLRHPATILPVLGTNNLGRIATLGDAARINLDRETWFELYTLASGEEVP